MEPQYQSSSSFFVKTTSSSIVFDKKVNFFDFCHFLLNFGLHLDFTQFGPLDAPPRGTPLHGINIHLSCNQQEKKASSPDFHRFFHFLFQVSFLQFLAIWDILAIFGAKRLPVGTLRMPPMVFPHIHPSCPRPHRTTSSI